MRAYWFRIEVDEEQRASPEEWTVCGEKFVRGRIGFKKYMYMETAGFTVTPGHILFDTNDSLEESSFPIKSAEDYIKRGCTLLLIQHLVTSIRHYREQYAFLLKKLEGIPLDYMVVPVIPAKVVKPEMVRYFARKGCPFLCIEVTSVSDLNEVRWEWLVQAQGHKRTPLTLFVKDSENTCDNYPELWSSLCNQYGIIKLTDLQDDEVVSFQNLRDSGIFPHKGGFISGGHADYNLYWNPEVATFDDLEKFRYHNAVPNVTVRNGQVTQVNQKIVNHSPGSHIKVKIHKHFV